MLLGFCSECQFDARETAAGDVRSNFDMRMEHIRHHIVYEGYRTTQMQPDWYLMWHLLDRNLIDRATYDRITTPTSVPRIPGSDDRHSSSTSYHRRLPQVEEEVVGGSSSSSGRDQHRSEHRREHNREHGSSSHKHRHRR